MATGVGTYYFVGAGTGGGTFTNPYLGGNGAVGAPTYSFSASPTTGMYSPAANQVAFAQNGVQALLFSGSQAATFSGSIAAVGGAFSGAVSGTTGTFSGVVTASVGAVGAPGYTFTGRTTNGMFSPAANQVAIVTNGTAALTFTSTQTATFAAAVTGTSWTGTGNVIANNADNAGGSGLSIGSVGNGVWWYYSGTSKIAHLADGSGAAAAYLVSRRFNLTKTAAYTVGSARLQDFSKDSSCCFDNTGASAQVVYTLPAATAGLTYTFINTAAGATFTLVQAVGTDKFASTGTLGANAGSLTSTQIWSSITIMCSTAGVWNVTCQTGTWTLA